MAKLDGRMDRWIEWVEWVDGWVFDKMQVGRSSYRKWRKYEDRCRLSVLGDRLFTRQVGESDVERELTFFLFGMLLVDLYPRLRSVFD